VARDDSRIRQSLTTTWQTTEVPPHKPTVADEVEHIGFLLFPALLYPRALPVFYEAFADAIEAGSRRAQQTAATAAALRQPGSAATWTATRNVGATTAVRDDAAQRAQALACYQSDLRALGDYSSAERGRVGFDAAIIERTDSPTRRWLRSTAWCVRARGWPACPYRQAAPGMRGRFRPPRSPLAPGAHPDADIADLEPIDASLAPAIAWRRPGRSLCRCNACCNSARTCRLPPGRRSTCARIPPRTTMRWLRSTTLRLGDAPLSRRVSSACMH
jgi:phosphoenolpyruvate carboxylase